MTWSLYDSTGYKGSFASGGCLRDLRDFIRLLGDSVLLSFINNGHYDDPQELASRIKMSGNKSVDDTLQNLKKIAQTCEDIIIFSQE